MPLPNVSLWVLSVWVASWAMTVRAQDVLSSGAAEQVQLALAEPEGHAEPEGYAEAVDAAILAHSAGHFEDAKAQLDKAHAIFPNARTLRGLGKLAFELHNYPAAVAHFEAALRSQVRPLDERLRAEVEALLLSARAWGRSAPSGARAKIGEVQLRIEPVDATQRFDVQSGESTELRMALRQVADPASQQIPAPVPVAKRLFARAPEGAVRPRTRWTRWLSVGLATAAAVGAAVAVGVAADPGPNERKAEGGTSGVVLKNP